MSTEPVHPILVSFDYSGGLERAVGACRECYERMDGSAVPSRCGSPDFLSPLTPLTPWTPTVSRPEGANAEDPAFDVDGLVRCLADLEAGRRARRPSFCEIRQDGGPARLPTGVPTNGSTAVPERSHASCGGVDAGAAKASKRSRSSSPSGQRATTTKKIRANPARNNGQAATGKGQSKVAKRKAVSPSLVVFFRC